jgi:hypothetical protein
VSRHTARQTERKTEERKKDRQTESDSQHNSASRKKTVSAFICNLREKRLVWELSTKYPI